MNTANNYNNYKTNLNNSSNELTNKNKWNEKKIYATSKDAFGKKKLNGCDTKLDSYGETPTYGRFDSSLEQALAWRRLEANTHNPNDLTWLKHELAERYHELKYSSGYSEAHNQPENLVLSSEVNNFHV